MKPDRFSPGIFVLMTALLLAAMLLCVCTGSVSIPLTDTVTVISRALRGLRCRRAWAKASFSTSACRACSTSR